MGRIRIETDGTVMGTRIVDEETGRELTNVERLELEITGAERDGFVSARLYLVNVPVRAVATVAGTVTRELEP